MVVHRSWGLLRMRHWLRGKVRLFLVGVLDFDDSRIVVCGPFLTEAMVDRNSGYHAATAGKANPKPDQTDNTTVC